MSTTAEPPGRLRHVDALMYGEAAFLLKWNGRAAAIGCSSRQHRPLERRLDAEHRRPDRRDVRRRERLAPRLHRRHRDRQPEQAHRLAPITFNLGATYITPNGNQVTSVTLQPVRAMILSKAGGTPPPPPPPRGPTTR